MDRDILEFLKDQAAGLDPRVINMIQKIDHMRDHSNELTVDMVEKISMSRILSSRTLSQNLTSESQAWALANQTLAEMIDTKVRLDFNNLSQLQMILCPSQSGLRSQAIFGEGEYVSVDLLPELLLDFELLLTRKDLHPLRMAAEVYIWLSTMHPFKNANGRVARLAADYFLLSNGYLPLVFASEIEAMVAKTKDDKIRTKSWAILRALAGVENAYLLIGNN